MADAVFTVKQASRLLQVSERTVNAWTREGRFPGAYMLYDSPRLGYRIPAGDVLDLIEKQNPNRAEYARRFVDEWRRAEFGEAETWEGARIGK